jgi:hypothetical protein
MPASTTRAAALDHLIHQLDDALGPDTTSGSWLFRVVDAPDDHAFGVLPLDAADHPVDALLGFRADPSWAVVGVIVHGHASDLGEPAELRRREPVRVLHALSRDDVETSMIRRLDGSTLVEAPGAAEGRLADCCRRVLGLPTAPASSPLLHWHATRWLDTVLQRAAVDPTLVPGWREVAQLHPLARRPVPADPAIFATMVRQRVGDGGWDGLRQRVAAGDEDDIVEPAIAAWMDAAMFARWHLATLPEPIDLLIDLTGLLPAVAVEPIIGILESWGLW